MADEKKELRQVIECIDDSNNKPKESVITSGFFSSIADALFDLKIKFEKDDSGIHIKIDKDKNK
jgi:hypothetical protein